MTHSISLEGQLKRAHRRGAHDASIGRPHSQADVCDWADLLESFVTAETPFDETDALQHQFGQAYERGYREVEQAFTARYQLRCFHSSRILPNDTYTIVLEDPSQGEPIPIDTVYYFREGNAVLIKGVWRTHDAAEREAWLIFRQRHCTRVEEL